MTFPRELSVERRSCLLCRIADVCKRFETALESLVLDSDEKPMRDRAFAVFSRLAAFCPYFQSKFDRSVESVSVRLSEEARNYILILSDLFDLPEEWVVKRLVEISVDLHRKGVFEFPDGSLNKEGVLGRDE